MEAEGVKGCSSLDVCKHYPKSPEPSHPQKLLEERSISINHLKMSIKTMFMTHANLQGLSRPPLFNSKSQGKKKLFQGHEVEDGAFR